MHRVGCGVDTQPMSSSTEGTMVSKWQRDPHPQAFFPEVQPVTISMGRSIQLWGTSSTKNWQWPESPASPLP